MKRLLATPIFTIIVLFLLCAPAFGQISQDGELNLFVGISAHTNTEFQIGPPQASPPVNAKFELANGLRGGVRFNIATNGHWGEEVYYSYEDNSASYSRQVVPTVNLPMKIHNLGVTGLYYFSGNEKAKTRPYLSFGVGATLYKPTDDAKARASDPARGNLPGFGQSNEFSFHYGIGFKHRMSRVVGLRVDVNHFIGRNPSYSMPRSSQDPADIVFPANGAIHNLEATGGLIFYFGK